jgi:hypothetical protein
VSRVSRATFSLSYDLDTTHAHEFGLREAPPARFMAYRLWTNVPQEGMVTLKRLQAGMLNAIMEPIDAYLFSWKFQKNEEELRRALGQEKENPPKNAPCWIDIPPCDSVVLHLSYEGGYHDPRRRFPLSFVFAGARADP